MDLSKRIEIFDYLYDRALKLSGGQFKDVIDLYLTQEDRTHLTELDDLYIKFLIKAIDCEFGKEFSDRDDNARFWIGNYLDRLRDEENRG
jgi:hypothetical protein